MQIIKTILKIFKEKGVYGIRALIEGKLFPNKIEFFKKMNLYLRYFKGKNGIEIGGPSAVFSREIPIYQAIKTLDGCNFSSKTIWEGNISEGKNFNYFENRIGYQYICEASNLQAIPNENYDFLISSHCLEHCANTLKTFKEWLRVLKKGGAIMLILPDKKYTFDHDRPVTTFEHLVDDFKYNIDEQDLTHLAEILELHDLRMDVPAGTIEQFKKRSEDNFNNRCLHHHVFDFELLENIFTHFDVKVIDMAFVKPYHQIILGIKT
jgi:SAM-dependent methyltransferase